MIILETSALWNDYEASRRQQVEWLHPEWTREQTRLLKRSVLLLIFFVLCQSSVYDTTRCGFVFFYLNSVILLNFNEKNQVTSPEIFSFFFDVTSVKSCKFSLTVA